MTRRVLLLVDGDAVPCHRLMSLRRARDVLAMILGMESSRIGGGAFFVVRWPRGGLSLRQHYGGPLVQRSSGTDHGILGGVRWSRLPTPRFCVAHYCGPCQRHASSRQAWLVGRSGPFCNLAYASAVRSWGGINASLDRFQWAGRYWADGLHLWALNDYWA